MASTSAASGTLMVKTQRHDPTAINQPPTSGPAAAATPVNPDQAPIVRARSSSRNEACRMARLAGVSSAPPMPWATRPATRSPAFGASPQQAERAANHTTPTEKTFRRP